jgi:type I restriction enzyme M protein
MYRTGAAIPAISDKDFSNILVYLPPQNEMDDIVSSMEKSFKLRNDASDLLSKIESEINIKHITNISLPC